LTLYELTDPNAVMQAVAECDRLGRDRFLSTYNFHRARDYFLIVNGREYDSKAIVGVAHRYQFPLARAAEERRVLRWPCDGEAQA
jgi:5-methylcytosine-specific restriction protein A